MTQEEFFKRYTYSPSRDRIGGGGFGTVYKAKDNVLHREVAIKVSEVKTTADGKKTFSLKDEFEALAHVPKHPNIANYEEFYSYESPQGLFDYAVMQYYPDGNLSKTIKRGLSEEQKEDIARQLLDGIAFLHKHKVVHRDLKPGNILIVKDGNKIIPLITDFGLSKSADSGEGSEFSNSFGGGTQRYSSPEQLQGQPLRLNTDLWSYGAIVYELFTSKPLFASESEVSNSTQANLEIFNKIIRGEVEGLDKLPDQWHRVAERCLVINPQNRAKSADELFQILAEVKDETEMDVAEQEAEPIKVAPHGHKAALSPKTERIKIANLNKKWLWMVIGAMALVVLLIVVFAGGGKDKLTVTANGVSFNLLKVEGGSFQMGADDSDAFDDEKPVHHVKVNSFHMGETEVTQALWNAVMGTSVIQQSGTNDATKARGEGRDYPMYFVSWHDCQDFIRKLSDITGKNFRLPTEAEWEYAARGGNKSDNYKFAGSNAIDNVAWYDQNGNTSTHPVMMKSPNELGFYDMCGNVWEWCSDWSGLYGSASQTNPQGAVEGTNRVFRGGSWSTDVQRCRVTNRRGGKPDIKLNNLGFRLVLDD